MAAPKQYWAAIVGTSCLTMMGSTVQAATPTDACQVLSAAEVGAAVGATFAPGTHVTPTFTKTCTWIAGSQGIIVTLNIQPMSMIQAGKGGFAAIERTGATGVGEEAYYLGVGPTVGLSVRKGGAAFKVSVYSRKLSLEQRKAIEKSLAQKAAARF